MLCVLAIVKQSDAFNQSGRNPRWTFTDDETEYYDDDSDDYGQAASNHMSMKVKPTTLLPIKSYQPILLVPDPPAAQPVQNVIVAKTTPVKPKAPYANNGQGYGRSPYDTPPGSFTPQSYSGPSNYGNSKRF